MGKLWAFLRLSRLHFLLGGFLMFAVGANVSGEIELRSYLLAQIMVTMAQLTAHYANEYGDYEADKRVVNRTSFSGGSGVLVSGVLSPVVALRAAYVTTVSALVFALLVATISIPAAVLGVIALAVSWAYSVRPLRLLGTGYGELATSITVAGIVPCIGMFSQRSDVDGDLWAITMVLMLMHTAMLLAFELPDIESDRAVGKMVLAVRIGPTQTIHLMMFLVGAATVVALSTSNAEALGGVIVALGMLSAAKRDMHALTTFAGVAAFFVTGVALLVGA